MEAIAYSEFVAYKPPAQVVVSKERSLQKRKISQVSFIYHSFVATAFETANDKNLTPLVIKDDNAIEIHGYFTQQVVELALEQLHDEVHRWSEDAMSQIITDDTGKVTAIRFTRP